MLAPTSSLGTPNGLFEFAVWILGSLNSGLSGPGAPDPTYFKPDFASLVRFIVLMGVYLVFEYRLSFIFIDCRLV